MTKFSFDAKKVEDFNIKITHPDKKLYNTPELTKLQIMNYYEAVGEKMLPYLNERLLSVIRCPRGISESCFFMKHPQSDRENVHTISIKEKEGGKGEYFYLENKEEILSQIEMNTLEFHTWGSAVKEPEKPDRVVFDLDPDTKMGLDKVKKGAKDIKEILDQKSLTSFLKTSGGKGYHIVIPIESNVSWDTVSDFAKSIAEDLEEKEPERYTSSSKKEERKNKIFIDWLRNTRGATIVAPYVARARKGAKVSMPIAWEELDSIAPDAIEMEEAVSRVDKEDPWEDFFEVKQELT